MKPQSSLVNMSATPPGHPRERAGRPGVLRRAAAIAAAGLCLLAAGLLPASASIYARQMGLDGLCANAHRIFRGTVTDVREGKVALGGAFLPSVTYVIKVSESLAGAAPAVIEMTVVGENKAPAPQGGVQRLVVLEQPLLEKGQEYLLFATKPSKVGLSTTVGLGQGCFKITRKGDAEFAVNAVNNAGLGIGNTSGPIDYKSLASEIRIRTSK